MPTSRTPSLLSAAVAARLAFEDACQQAGRDPETTITGPGTTGAAEASHAAFVAYTRSAGVGPHNTPAQNDEIRRRCRAEVFDGVTDALVERALPRAVGEPRLQVCRYAGVDPRDCVQVAGGARPVGVSRRALVVAALQDDPERARVYALALRDSLALP